MPRLEMRDPTAISYQISSRNPETISAWLMEMAELAVATPASSYPWNLTVWPLFSADGQPDWPVPAGVLYQMGPEAFGRLAKWLEAERGIGQHPEPRPVPEPEPAAEPAWQMWSFGEEVYPPQPGAANLPAADPRSSLEPAVPAGNLPAVNGHNDSGCTMPDCVTHPRNGE